MNRLKKMGSSMKNLKVGRKSSEKIEKVDDVKEEVEVADPPPSQSPEEEPDTGAGAAAADGEASSAKESSSLKDSSIPEDLVVTPNSEKMTAMLDDWADNTHPDTKASVESWCEQNELGRCELRKRPRSWDLFNNEETGRTNTGLAAVKNWTGGRNATNYVPYHFLRQGLKLHYVDVEDGQKAKEEMESVGDGAEKSKKGAFAKLKSSVRKEKLFPSWKGCVHLGFLCDVRISNTADPASEFALDLVMLDDVETLCFNDKDEMMMWANLLYKTLSEAAVWRNAGGIEKEGLKRKKPKMPKKGGGGSRLVDAMFGMAKTTPFQREIIEGSLADVQAYAAEQNKLTNGAFCPVAGPSGEIEAVEGKRYACFDLDTTGSTAIFYAVFYRKPEEMLDWLLSLGFMVNRANVCYMPLHTAAYNGDIKRISWLLHHGSLVTRRTNRVLPFCVDRYTARDICSLFCKATSKDECLAMLEDAELNPRKYAPGYDVFISYRVDANADDAEQLRFRLLPFGLRVYLDKVELEDGRKWDAGFCAGLCSSKLFLPIISQGALCNMKKLGQRPDNVLLEWDLALELKDMDKIKAIFPVFAGLVDGRGYDVYDATHINLDDFMDTPHLPTKEKLEAHLAESNLNLSDEGRARSVRDVLKTILEYNGAHLHHSAQPKQARNVAAEKIVSMVRAARPTSMKTTIFSKRKSSGNASEESPESTWCDVLLSSAEEMKESDAVFSEQLQSYILGPESGLDKESTVVETRFTFEGSDRFGKYVIFAPLLTPGSVQSLQQLKPLENDYVDPFLVDMMVALELMECGKLDRIFPIMAGEFDERGYTSYFALDLQQATEVSPACKERATEILLAHDIEPTEEFEERGIAATLNGITQYQGYLLNLAGLRGNAIERASKATFDRVREVTMDISGQEGGK